MGNLLKYSGIVTKIRALAAIKQESGSWKWALFAACYTTGLAWLVAFSVYQIGGMFV